MPSNGKYRSTRRLHLVLIAIAATVIYLTFFRSSSQPPIEPLPGTYQYFHETDFLSESHKFGGVSHVDSRYVPSRKPEANEVRHDLDLLLRSYVATMHKLDIDTWLAHGGLLGWYWNRKLLPWDTDLDFQMSDGSLQRLAKSNMTEHVYKDSEHEPARKYLIDVNPHHKIHSHRDVANKIDGRWIDTTSGKFVDITAVHAELQDAAKPDPSQLYCKDGHHYDVSSVTWTSQILCLPFCIRETTSIPFKGHHYRA